MVDKEELQRIEEEVEELQERRQMRRRKNELEGKKRKLELQERWYGQVFLGLRIYLTKLVESVKSVFDALTQPPTGTGGGQAWGDPPHPNNRQKQQQGQEGRGEEFDPDQAAADLYKAMGGHIDED